MSALLTGLFFYSAAGTAAAQCLTSGLNEEDQLAMARGLFEDGLFSASSETAKCYLEEFSESTAREEVFFLLAEALRKGGDLQGAVKAYDELNKNFPNSKTYRDNALLQKGISLAISRKYPAAIETLKSLLHDFPQTTYRDEAHYWLGYATSYSAELSRKKNKKEALWEYLASTQHFIEARPETLRSKQQQERWYLMGRAWWFLKDITKAEEAWSQYLKRSKSIEPEQASNLKYQLATSFQQEKNYAKAEKWFARIAKEHPDSKLASASTFLRAEMAYADSVQKTKTEALDSLSISRLVKYYKLYLDKKDNEHQALTYYRIGVLQQTDQPNETISAFQKYLNTKDKTYATEVLYRLGYLYIETNHQKKAIQTFEKYLSMKDKTYTAEVHYRLGNLFIETKQHKKAIQIFEKYLNMNDKTYTAEVYYRLGYLFIESKQQKKAIQIFEKYLSTNNKTYTAEVHYHLGNLYIETKQQKKAIQTFEKYLNTNDKTYGSEVLYQLAYLYIEAKRPKKAIQIFEKYLSMKDKTLISEVHYRLGYLYLETKQQKKAIESFEEYLNSKAKTYSAEVNYQLAFLYIETKQQKKAIKIFEKYLSTNDKTYVSEVLYRLAFLYIDANQQKKAIDSFNKYLNLKDKTHTAEVQYQLGFLYIETKQQKKAIKIFEKYLAGDDEEHLAEIQLRLGYLYIETKQQKKAIKIFEKYLASGAILYTAETQLSLGYLYVEAKKPFLAIAALEEVRLHPDYQRNYELLQTLMELYRENVSEEKYVRFLLTVISDHNLEEKVRHDFHTQLIIEYFEQKKCERLISELNNDPGYMQNSKISNTKEWQHLIYMRGSCLIETKRWNEARSDLRQIRDTEKYRGQSIRMLLEAHKHLEDWKSITWEFQEVYDRKSPVLTTTDFQLWVFAAQRRQDFQSLERLEIIYERWKKSFPDDSQKLDEVNRYISGKYLQELTEQENWKGVSSHIRKELQLGYISLDDQIFSQLLFAEQKLENWAGVMSAYALLRKHDPKRAETLDTLISQAEAAEKLGKKELSLGYYRQALKVKPLNEKDKKKQIEIKKYLAQSSFEKWIEKEEWSKVTKAIRQEVKTKKRILDDANFELLLYAENQKSGSKKHNGILDAYDLLRKHVPKRTETLDELINQAEAAEKLGKKELSLKYYQQALKVKPLNEKDKKKQIEIKKYLAQSSFKKWIEKEEWSKVTKAIRQEVKAKMRILDDANFELLLYAENQKSGSKKYNGILDAYALLARYNKEKTLTVKAQIDQGYAAEKLGGYRRAKGYYRRALKKVPDNNVDLVLQLVGELKQLYERSKDYKSLVSIYKRAYSALKKSSRPKKEYRTYAYLIGYHQSSHLKQNNKARIWLMRSDGGGSSPQELQSAFWVAKLDLEANKPEMALKRLKELAGRKVPKNSSLYVQIHFELGTLYHLKEKWKSALRHYRLVAKARAPAELKQFQKAAKEKAKEIDNYLKSIQSSQG